MAGDHSALDAYGPLRLPQKLNSYAILSSLPTQPLATSHMNLAITSCRSTKQHAACYLSQSQLSLTSAHTDLA